MKILVVGATGMLGSAMFRILSAVSSFQVHGTIRNENGRRHFSENLRTRLIAGIDVENVDSLVKMFAIARPDVVINCVGLVKQLAEANDPLQSIPMNSMLPHRMAALCKATSARFIHISTDCVFSGKVGNYKETDLPDAYDLYGRTKLLGEVDYAHAITLRTSIIGHELTSSRSLIGWFLEQNGIVKGFTKAYFSGLPTVELAAVVRDFVLPRPELHGLYHVSAKPINKHDLLKLVAAVYGKKIEIEPNESVVIDRSLDSSRFKEATGYVAADWPILIQRMFEQQ